MTTVRKFLVLTAAALSAAFPSTAATPAATTQWVSNYVNTAIAAIPQEDLPTNVVSGTINLAAKTLSFVCDGELCVVGIAATNAAAATPAFRVFESSDPSAVPTNAVFALDESTGRYANRTLAFPNDLALTVTNGCCRLSQSNGVWTTQSSGNTNFAYVAVESNGVHRFSFWAQRVSVTRSEALAAGVTNAAAVAFAPVARSAFDLILEAICGAAYADGDTSSETTRATTFEYLISYDLDDGTTKTTSVLFSYDGEVYDWNVQPDEGYPAATATTTYVPNIWAYSDDWYNAGNWTADGESGGKIVITSYVKKKGGYKEVSVSVTRTKLVELGGVGLNLMIPAFVAPELVEKPQTDLCKEGKHNWQHCECDACHTTRSHHLVEGAAGTCWRCDNLDGIETKKNRTKCGSSCAAGKYRSDVSYHFGWHDSDGVSGNMTACTCECDGKSEWEVGWQLSHDPSGDKSNVGEGFRTEDGTVDPTTRATYHHFSMKCSRDRGDGDTCGADVYYNEVHDFKATDGTLPVPFVGDHTDPESVVKLAHGEQAEEANELRHWSSGMECAVCGRESSEFDLHAFADDSCECIGCGLVLHEKNEAGVRDGGYACGSKTVPGCAKCNTYSKTGDRVEGRLSNLTEELHDCQCVDDDYHVCVCGRVRALHAMEKTSKTHWKCHFCPYSYDAEEDHVPPNPYVDYVVGGRCGEWTLRGGGVVAGGTLALADGTTQNFPSSHAFGAVTNRLCHRCTNANPITGGACGAYDLENISRHGGWHHQAFLSSNLVTHTSGHCVCQCGRFHRDHTVDPDGDHNYVTGADDTCKMIGHCQNIGPCEGDTKCGEDCTNAVEHAFAMTNLPPVYVDSTNHQVASTCVHGDAPGCGLVTNMLYAHAFSETGEYDESFTETNHWKIAVCTGNENGGCGCTNLVSEAHTFGDGEWERLPEQCRFFKLCDCGYETNLLELADHVPDENDLITPYGPVTSAYNQNEAYYHSVSSHCSRVNNSGDKCGHPAFVRTERCQKSLEWELVDNPDAKDKSKCFGCHAWREYAHRFYYVNALQCRCTNGDGHLLADHNWSGDTCTRCGYNRATGYISTNSVGVVTYVTNSCASCSTCYAVARLVDFRLDQYTEKHCGSSIDASCDWEWDVVRNRCGCPMCAIGMQSCCLCGSLGLFEGPIHGPVDICPIFILK